jgi:hypothetical protein
VLHKDYKLWLKKRTYSGFFLNHQIECLTEKHISHSNPISPLKHTLGFTTLLLCFLWRLLLLLVRHPEPKTNLKLTNFKKKTTIILNLPPKIKPDAYDFPCVSEGFCALFAELLRSYAELLRSYCGAIAELKLNNTWGFPVKSRESR